MQLNHASERAARETIQAIRESLALHRLGRSGAIAAGHQVPYAQWVQGGCRNADIAKWGRGVYEITHRANHTTDEMQVIPGWYWEAELGLHQPTERGNVTLVPRPPAPALRLEQPAPTATPQPPVVLPLHRATSGGAPSPELTLAQPTPAAIPQPPAILPMNKPRRQAIYLAAGGVALGLLCILTR